jgi:ABC-type transporter Mla MlaB component
MMRRRWALELIGRPLSSGRPPRLLQVVATSDGSRVIVVAVEGLERADLAVVDALARLQLAARRLGCSIRLRNANAELRALLDLVGLADVVPDAVLPLEAPREAEGGKQLGVEEMVQPGDPAL